MQQKDLDLLTDAARSIGYDLEHLPEYKSPVLRGFFDTHGNQIPFDPLTNDKTAFSLVVRLGLRVSPAGVDVLNDGAWANLSKIDPDEYIKDRFKATRKAIVVAAAEIGKINTIVA